MISEFLRWFRANERRWQDSNILARIKCSTEEDMPLEKGVIELEAKLAVASFTVWGDGALEIIILDVLKKEELVVKDRQVANPNDMVAILDQSNELFMKVTSPSSGLKSVSPGPSSICGDQGD